MVPAKPGAVYKYICIKKNLLPAREPYGSFTYNINLCQELTICRSGEAETLHMSQLAGGWDFLTLSDGRCAPKK